MISGNAVPGPKTRATSSVRHRPAVVRHGSSAVRRRPAVARVISTAFFLRLAPFAPSGTPRVTGPGDRTPLGVNWLLTAAAPGALRHAVRKCGCGIHDEAPMIDKLSWESSVCPADKW